MKKKLVVKPPQAPDLKVCEDCLVKAACESYSSGDYYDCPMAISEFSKNGLGLFWPIELDDAHDRDILIKEGYSEEDADLMVQIAEIIQDIRKRKLTIRPATKRDRNVVKFVVTEYDM